MEVRITEPGQAIPRTATRFPLDGLTARFTYPMDFLFAELQPGTYVIEVRKDVIDVIGSGTVVLH